MEDERSSTSDGFEESGWTMYFDDLYATTNNDVQHEDVDHDRHDQYCVRSSLISDDASFVAKNSNSSSSCDLRKEEAAGLPIPGRSQCSSPRLSFKKRRTTGGVVDHALEDTASSPVHSSWEKGNGSSPIEERSGSGFKERRDTDINELKKKGLFLVPISVAVNYIG